MMCQLHRVAAALEQSGEPYCILHGWSEPEESTDVDIAVSPGALPVLANALEGDGWRGVQVIPYEVGTYYFVATTEHNGTQSFLCIDAITDFRCGGRLYIPNHELLANLRQHRGVRIASPQAEFAY